MNRAAQADHICSGVSTGHVCPARIFSPVFLESRYLLFACQCHGDKPLEVGLAGKSCSAKTPRLSKAR
ncbi:Unknown protein sequence [Pseudomonas syringae pv. syringae]|nr:Unknown protein sequence [Pseudomonas syringae pv. syringae]